MSSCKAVFNCLGFEVCSLVSGLLGGSLQLWAGYSHHRRHWRTGNTWVDKDEVARSHLFATHLHLFSFPLLCVCVGVFSLRSVLYILCQLRPPCLRVWGRAPSQQTSSYGMTWLKANTAPVTSRRMARTGPPGSEKVEDTHIKDT